MLLIILMLFASLYFCEKYIKNPHWFLTTYFTILGLIVVIVTYEPTWMEYLI